MEFHFSSKDCKSQLCITPKNIVNEIDKGLEFSAMEPWVRIPRILIFNFLALGLVYSLLRFVYIIRLI